MELSNLYKTEGLKTKSLYILVFNVLLFFLLILRLWYLQIIQGEDLRSLAENNRIRVKSIANYRGNILDGSGDVIVSLRPSFNLYLTKEDAKELKNELDFLRKSVDLGESPDLDKIKIHPAHKELLLKRDLNRKEVAFIEENGVDLSGFSIKVEPMRDYKYQELAAQIVGYLGEIRRGQLESFKDGPYRLGDFIGQYGLESRFENFLKGEKGVKSVEVDAAGRELKILKKDNPVPGNNIVLTIDKDLQLLVEKEMEGKQGSVVVLDPQNGNILAIVSKPSFDPNIFAKGVAPSYWKQLIQDESHPLENRAIKGLYPPGSTYKVVMAAAGLEKGVITEDTTYFCPGYFQLGTRNYRCWKKGGHGLVSIHRAIVQSCDVFFYQVGYHLGIDAIAQYAMGFGLGAPTGFDPENEKSGLVPTQAWKLRAKKEQWHPGETISASIGQGYNIVTPLQLANLIAAVGNGGTLYKPNIIKSIQKPNGEIIQETKPEIIGRLPVSRETLRIIREGLLGVTTEQGGTAWRSRVPGVDMAGKTGTAQVVRMKEGWDEDSQEEIPYKYRDHALFIAFAPYEKPLLAMSIIVEHGGHGGSTSAPIAQKIVQSLPQLGYFKLKMGRLGPEDTEASGKKL